jgi:hypothetical protein
MKTAIALLAAGAVLFGAPMVNLALNPIQPAAAATAATKWHLVLEVGGDEFVIDSFTNSGDCVAMLRDAKPRGEAVKLALDYRCERTRITR